MINCYYDGKDYCAEVISGVYFTGKTQEEATSKAMESADELVELSKRWKERMINSLISQRDRKIITQEQFERLIEWV